MPTLREMQQACLAARERTGCREIGQTVEGGPRFRTVLTIYRKNGTSIVLNMTGQNSANDHLHYLGMVTREAVVRCIEAHLQFPLKNERAGDNELLRKLLEKLQ